MALRGKRPLAFLAPRPYCARVRARLRSSAAAPDQIRSSCLSPFTARGTAVALASLSACQLHAQGVATDTTLDVVVVSGERAALPTNVPNSTSSKTAEDLREQNLFNPEDALDYVSNTTVRKRYIGDRNALIGGRSFGTTQPSRALVYLDGYLIRNFLGRFDAPRWNMVTPESIARVDVLYGPFSALYPGNSIGTTVVMTQRAPKSLEVSGRMIGYTQRFEQYGHGDHFDGNQLSLHLGHRLGSGLWFTTDVNRQSSTSQPMQYYAVSADASGAFPRSGAPTSGAPTPVKGVVYDTDPKGLRRAIFSASGGAIDDTVQDTLNVRGGYRFTPSLEVSAMASLWHNDSRTRNDTFLTDTAGGAVWQGAPVTVMTPGKSSTRYLVSDGASVFELPPTAFAPSSRRESHRQLGLTLKTRYDSGWNGSVVLSDYRILRDAARQANNPDPVASAGGTGTVTHRDGTGWNTLEVQATWTPTGGDWTGGRHALAFGLHRNAYRLNNTVANASDWRTVEDPQLSQLYRAKTEVTAAYAQDTWALHPDLKLTLGWREEQFRSFDGNQLGGGATVSYPGRRLTGHSPKASIAWTATDDLLLKLSVGRGVRFPNVEELYNGTVTATSQTLSDPNLKPEVSNAAELSVERDWSSQHLRVSLFHDDVRDAILRQTDMTVLPNVTRVSNVDRVKTSGVEFAYGVQNWLVKGLSLDLNAAFTHSLVAANGKDPQSVGKWWLRVPRTRGNALLTYRPNDVWMGSIGYRHEGRSWNDTYNLDVNPDVFGGSSRVNQLDVRTSYRMTREIEFALGVNNLANAHAYQYHPYPGRTLFAEVRFNH
jgi:iron complex outermembrane receptor protein